VRELHKKFPVLRNFESKSIHVKEGIMFGVLELLDSKGVRMVCYQFKDFQWKRHERMLNALLSESNPRHKYRSNFFRFYEKIMGVLYYYALRQISVNKKYHYEVVACIESNIDIWEVFRTIQKMSKRDGYHFNPSANIRRIEYFLKLADFVAGANKRLDDFKLSALVKHTALRDPIRERDLKKAFNIK
jgi:hypothetical protein